MKAVGKLFSIGLLTLAALFASAQDDKRPSRAAQSDTNAGAMELKGRLDLSKQAGAPVQFKTESGAVYTLISNRTSAALFTDTNLLGKTLVLKGRALEGAHRFEVSGNLRSMRAGKVHELYYYCDICSIKGSETGPCMCCREPVHLIEKPTGGDDH
jgi:hypothetical protein